MSAMETTPAPAGTPRDERHHNQRRFVRVPVRGRAYFCGYSFTGPDDRVTPPRFQPAELLQIGGPGLLLRADADVRVDQEVLLAVEVPSGGVFRGRGVIRRVVPSATQPRTFAVEMLHLAEGQVAKMAAVTNRVAIFRKRQPLDAAPAGNEEAAGQ